MTKHKSLKMHWAISVSPYSQYIDVYMLRNILLSQTIRFSANNILF